METTQILAPKIYADALACWPEINFGGLQPKFSTLLGAIFLAASDGSISYFNPFDGELSRPWANRDALVSEINTPAGDDEYLLGALAFGAEQRGTALRSGQIYVYAPHPSVGGFGPENLMAMDFVPAHYVYAQWQRQFGGLAH